MVLLTMIARVADGLPLAASMQEDEQVSCTRSPLVPASSPCSQRWIPSLDERDPGNLAGTPFSSPVALEPFAGRETTSEKESLSEELEFNVTCFSLDKKLRRKDTFGSLWSPSQFEMSF